MLRVIMITGSRVWTDHALMHAVLWEHHATSRQLALFHGDCEGADHMARDIATALGWEVNRLPGFWHLGSVGGKKRNEALVHATRAFKHAGAETFVEAFPTKQSVGTHHAIGFAIKMGLQVRVTWG